jgi:hypothetical protein
MVHTVTQTPNPLDIVEGKLLKTRLIPREEIIVSLFSEGTLAFLKIHSLIVALWNYVGHNTKN